MNNSVAEYYQKNLISGFEDIIIVEKETKASFEELKKLAPNFPKAWHELSQLDLSDKIEFSSLFFSKTIPYLPHIYPKVLDFFSNLEDLSVIMSKKPKLPNYDVELVYSMMNDSTFFRGRPPLDSFSISLVNRQFNESLPHDFLSFLKIHNGFAKNNDSGVIEAENIYDVTNNMLDLIEDQKKIVTCNNQIIDPKDLIFFYQSYQKVDFQCFYNRWVSNSDIGNVYYSYSDSTISNFHDKATENMAFATFLDWLVFYLEMVEF
ncbi:MAG: SMI1/KNR4 family protein [Parachlamydiales bacterium]|jgi:hypothetical protein